MKPDQDLLEENEVYTSEKKIEAGCILSSVGSLSHATLRQANQFYENEYKGPFEILSLNGAVSTSGSHLHISIANGGGQAIGGHLVRGCKIYATAKIVFAQFMDVVYKREYAEDSGYEELVVCQK